MSKIILAPSASRVSRPVAPKEGLYTFPLVINLNYSEAAPLPWPDLDLNPLVGDNYIFDTSLNRTVVDYSSIQSVQFSAEFQAGSVVSYMWPILTFYCSSTHSMFSVQPKAEYQSIVSLAGQRAMVTGCIPLICAPDEKIVIVSQFPSTAPTVGTAIRLSANFNNFALEPYLFGGTFATVPPPA